MAKSKKTNKKNFVKTDSKVYFTNLKTQANVQLFNLKHTGMSNLDPVIVEKALKNLVFYADKQIDKLSKPTTENV